MKILMIAPQFRPIIGGYERAAERLSGELCLFGCAVTVVTERRDPRWPKHEQRHGVSIRRLPTWYRPRFHILTSLVSYAIYLARHGRRFDVWHVHQYGVHVSLAVLMGRVLRRPVAIKITNTAAEGIGKTAAAGVLTALHTWTHRRVAACFCVSRETADEALAFGIPHQALALIGNGVDTDLLQPATMDERQLLRQRLGLPPGPMVICVATFKEAKNHSGLLDAWSAAQAQLAQSWSLVLLGDGPLRPSIEAKIAALGLKSRVFLPGLSDQVADWLRAADFFVMASRWEGLSNAALEAMACGLPGVVTAVSGMSALIGETGAGRLVPLENTAALAEALVEVCRSKTGRDEMGRRARDTILQNYSIRMTASKHLEVYHSMMMANS